MWAFKLVNYPDPLSTNQSGGTNLGKYFHVGGAFISPLPYHIPPHKPLVPTTLLLPHYSGTIFGKYIHYLGSLIFSLRPDEVASVWR